MNPTNRSNVGNSQGGQNNPLVGADQNTPRHGRQPSQYDPIFSPSGMAGAGTGIYNSPAPAPSPTQPEQPTPTPTSPISSGQLAGNPLTVNPATPKIITAAPAPAPTSSQHTTSTATGDIILQPSTPQTKKKPILPIVLGALAVLLVGAGLFVIIANPFSNNQISASATASFNKFMNYLYDGSDSTEPNAAAYSESAGFKFEEMLISDNQEERSQYFTTAQAHFQEMQSGFNQRNDESQSQLVSSISEELDFLAALANTTELTDSAILDYYIQNGRAAVTQLVEDGYSAMVHSDNSAAASYGQAKTNLGLVIIDELKLFSDHKCLQTDGFSSSCTEDITIDDALASRIEKAYADSQAADGTAAQTIESLVSHCRELSEKIGANKHDNE